MKKVFKLIFTASLLTFSSFTFAEDVTANAGRMGISFEDPAITAQKNKSYIERDIKEIREFMARDNALTQKFVKDKNLKPFIDEGDEFDKIEELQTKLIANQLDFGEKETVTEIIKAQQNFIKNLDIKWDLAKARGYFNLEKTTPVFDRKRARNENDLQKLKNKLSRL